MSRIRFCRHPGASVLGLVGPEFPAPFRREPRCFFYPPNPTFADSSELPLVCVGFAALNQRASTHRLGGKSGDHFQRSVPGNSPGRPASFRIPYFRRRDVVQLNDPSPGIFLGSS